MSRYKKKPVVINAFKYQPQQVGTLIKWLDSFDDHKTDITVQKDHLIIHTLEGDMRADKGDWVIRGIQGEYYPCKPDIFEATYELAE